jgi:hypothetical protein
MDRSERDTALCTRSEGIGCKILWDSGIEDDQDALAVRDWGVEQEYSYNKPGQ